MRCGGIVASDLESSQTPAVAARRRLGIGGEDGNTKFEMEDFAGEREMCCWEFL